MCRFLSVYVLNYSSLQEVGRRFLKKKFSKAYLRYIKKKTLITFHCVILHVVRNGVTKIKTNCWSVLLYFFVSKVES